MCEKSLKIPKRKSEAVNRRTDKCNGQQKKDKRINNDLPRNQKIEQHEPNYKPRVNYRMVAVPTPHVTPLVLLLLQTRHHE